jgi:two-component system sensor histidine kinase KdpD
MPADQAQRASPDALLSLAKKEGRGHLKIFLGAAPGVGKTYAMLTSARAEKFGGRDVVAGLIETHGRRETEQLTEGFETLPRKPIVYRNQVMRTPMFPAAAIPSDGRMSTNCWLPASTCGRP